MSGYPGEGGPTVDGGEWLDARGVNGSRTTGPTYPERMPFVMPTWRAGDPDPTAGAGPWEVPTCYAPSDVPGSHRSCTWPRGHTHPQHIAGGLKGIVLEVWPVAL